MSYAEKMKACMLIRWARAAAFLLCAFAAATTHSASWKVINSTPGGFRYEVDTDSLQQIQQGEYRVLYRWGVDLERDFSLETLSLDCFNQSALTTRSVTTNRNMFRGEPEWQVSVSDFAAGTVTRGGRTSPVSADERMRALSFPTLTEPKGKILRMACAEESLFKALHEATGLELQRKSGCDRPDMQSAPLCKPDVESRELLGQMITRLGQAARACALTDAQVNLLGRVWLKDAEVCRAGNCDLQLMAMRISGLGTDLARAAAGQPCTYIPPTLKSAEQAEARDEGVARFRECLKKSVPELDDRISPANVVAEGVFAACRGQLSADMVGNTTFASTVLPSLTTMVLRHRQESRKPEPPTTKPTRPSQTRPAKQ